MWSGDKPRMGITEERLAAARAVTVPTLLVRGARSEIVSDLGFRRMRELMPHAQASVVPEGHMLVGESNDSFTRELDSFLRSPFLT
jgi:pimeloyl-ACP methyl ester carboxylesterase